MSQSPELIKVVAELLRTELDIPPNPPRVFIYNQKWDIPNIDDMFLCVTFLSDKPFAANTRTENDPTSATTLNEVQSIVTQETYQIDVFSRNSEARIRKHEVIFALQSTQAQQLSEKYSFQIGHIPASFVDVSAIEAAARLNRYAITFHLLRAYTRTKAIPAFTSFQNPPRTLLVNP